jgi:hypothetical protein
VERLTREVERLRQEAIGRDKKLREAEKQISEAPISCLIRINS